MSKKAVEFMQVKEAEMAERKKRREAAHEPLNLLRDSGEQGYGGYVVDVVAQIGIGDGKSVALWTQKN